MNKKRGTRCQRRKRQRAPITGGEKNLFSKEGTASKQRKGSAFEIGNISIQIRYWFSDSYTIKKDPKPYPSAISSQWQNVTSVMTRLYFTSITGKRTLLQLIHPSFLTLTVLFLQLPLTVIVNVTKSFTSYYINNQLPVLIYLILGGDYRIHIPYKSKLGVQVHDHEHNHVHFCQCTHSTVHCLRIHPHLHVLVVFKKVTK